jgi:hypothetical protein
LPSLRLPAGAAFRIISTVSPWNAPFASSSEIKISSVSPLLDLLKDSQGNINISDIITEMTTSVMDTKSFDINVPVVGNITIGNGHIKFPIPYTDQIIVLNRQDIEELKTVLTNNIE